MGFYEITKFVLKSMFKKPATLMYPEVPRQWQERTRGSIDFDETKCILCSVCVQKCPIGAITVSKEQRIWLIERMCCIQCGSCVDICPEKCLTMNQQYTAPSETKTIYSAHVPVL